jgi:hypothetical protein
VSHSRHLFEGNSLIISFIEKEMVVTLTFTCMCKDENDGSRRRHECTAEDNRRKDVPGFFQFLCSECSWHAARCLLCDKLYQWDKTSSVSAARHGSKVYNFFFKSTAKHTTPPKKKTPINKRNPTKGSDWMSMVKAQLMVW